MQVSVINWSKNINIAPFKGLINSNNNFNQWKSFISDFNIIMNMYDLVVGNPIGKTKKSILLK